MDINHASMPAMLTFKYMFGGRRFTGYLGFDVGFHISTTESELYWKKDKRNGAAIGAPIGLMVWVSDGVYINGNYQFTWLAESFLANDSSHMVNLGVGFQF